MSEEKPDNRRADAKTALVLRSAEEAVTEGGWEVLEIIGFAIDAGALRELA
jgi:hypothetical protein